MLLLFLASGTSIGSFSSGIRNIFFQGVSWADSDSVNNIKLEMTTYKSNDSWMTSNDFKMTSRWLTRIWFIKIHYATIDINKVLQELTMMKCSKSIITRALGQGYL